MVKWQYECYDSSLLDDDFLIQLYNQKTRDIYARIISLDINELPVDRIEGKVTGGSINIDGDSAVRRSCSLSLVTEDIDINEYYWGIKTKFKLEIGLKNNLTNEYAPDGKYWPDIVWFKGGTYLISSFNTSISTNSCNISIQGKDKMCLLNGDFSGQIFASIDFGTEEYQEKTLTKENPTYIDSQNFMMQEYYYKFFSEDSQYDIIYQSNNSFSFLQDPEGQYWKNGNRYEKNSNKIPKYQIYKLIEEPEELFEQSPLFEPRSSNPEKIQALQNYYNDNKEKIFTLMPKFTYSNDNQQITGINPQSSSVNYFVSIVSNSSDFESFKELYGKNRDAAWTIAEREGCKINGSISFLAIQDKINNLNQQLSQQMTEAERQTIRNKIIELQTIQPLLYVYKLKDLYTVDYEYSIQKIPVEKIIREAVHTYAKEPYHNIIINDLDNYGLEQLSYRGDKTLYALRERNTRHFSQITFNKNNFLEIPKGFQYDNLVDELTSEQITNNHLISYTMPGDSQPKQYTVAKIEFGDDLGYRITDLTYTGDLISSIGESLTSILDKIKTMFGNFEYFYDVDGRFIFQEKKNYVNTAWSQIINNGDETYTTYSNDSENKKIAFNFEGNILLTAINNTPVLNDVKNDYSVWGKRKSISGAEIPIHARYAIDKKPVRYEAFDGRIFVTAAAGDADRVSAIGATSPVIVTVDWRELIYQMAKDYFLGQGCSEKSPIYNLNGELVINEPDHFLYTVGLRNPNYYPTGITGYEQYYTDMEGFWRQLYNPDYIPQLVYTKGRYESSVEKIGNSNFYSTVKNWSNAYISDITIDYYFDENLAHQQGIDTKIENTGQEIQDLYNKYKRNQNDNQLYWNISVFEAPETLNFWIEFLDSENELAQFSIPVIGDRSKTVNEDKAGAIFFRQIPDLILIDKDDPEKVLEMRKIISEQSGYTFIYLPKGFSQYLSISYRSMSVKDKIDQLLYQFSYCAENISITSLPIYNLQPNRRIYVQDEKTKINGEYIVTKLTIPLTYNGTMSITANKAPERLY